MVGIDLENYDVLLTTLHCRVDIWTSGKKLGLCLCQVLGISLWDKIMAFLTGSTKVIIGLASRYMNILTRVVKQCEYIIRAMNISVGHFVHCTHHLLLQYKYYTS